MDSFLTKWVHSELNSDASACRTGAGYGGICRDIFGMGESTLAAEAIANGGRCRLAAQSSFRIVPVPRFLVNSELLLLPNRST
jgi:hypothetical protein